MANKRIDELTEKSDVLQDDDLILIYDSEESGSEKTKKVPISNYIAVIDGTLNLYVATTGSDTTGDGSSGSPWATPNKAIDWLTNKFITGNGEVNINIADGTYNSLTQMNPRLGTKQVNLIGNNTTPSNVTLNFQSGHRAINLGSMSYLSVKGIKFVGGGSQADEGIVANNMSFMHVNNCVIDNWYRGMYSYQNSFIQSYGDTVINNCSIGVIAAAISSSRIWDTDFTNCTYGIQSSQASEVGYQSSSVGFTNVTNNTDVNDNGRITAY
jgi:hypothetical protein